MTDTPQFQTQVIAKVIHMLAPIVIALVFIDLVATAIFTPDQWTRIIPTIIIFISFSVDWWLVRKNHIVWATNLFVFACGASILTGMFLNGGILAPVFSASIVLMATVAWLFRLKTAILFLPLWLVSSGAILYLQLTGRLPEIAPPHPIVYWIFMTSYMVMTFLTTVIPSSMIRKAFHRAEEQRQAIEAAQKLEKKANDALRERDQALEKSEALFRALVANIPGITFRCNPDEQRTMLFLSKMVEEITGHTPNEFVTKRVCFSNIIHPEDRKNVLKTIRQAVHRRTPYTIEYRIKHKNGGIRRVYERGQGIFDSPEHPRLAGVIMDITQEFERETLLHQAQKMQAVGQLAGGIAHDFNNMLSCIAGFAEVSLNELPPSSLVADNQRQILIASDRARKLVSKILRFSCQDQHVQACHSLKQLLQEALSLVSGTLPSSVVVDTVITEKSDIFVNMDIIQFHEVIMNLAANSVDAMTEKGKLTFRLGRRHPKEQIQGRISPLPPGKYAVLEVTDTGQGMNPVTLEKMFEPFYTTKEIGHGTGIGLSVVWGIMQNLGGNIQVETSLNQGTTIRLFFPEISKPKAFEAQSDSLIPQGRERILFVDDEPMMTRMATDLVGSLGYEVFTATNGNAAIKIISEASPPIDLVITDQTMPEITGVELAKKILGRHPSMPIIICTGYSRAINETKAKQLGITHFMMKPIRKKELASAIHNALRRSK